MKEKIIAAAPVLVTGILVWKIWHSPLWNFLQNYVD
jgi:hypothetical protein